MHFLLDRTLKRLEREGNDDLLMVYNLGPQYYSTPELYELLNRLEEQGDIVSRKLNRLYRLGTFIPLLVISAFLAGYFNEILVAAICLVLVPVIGGFFTYRSMRIRRDYPTYYDSQTIEYKIRQELKRRQESSIF